MNAHTEIQEPGPLKKKKSLRQLFIPSRQKSQRNRVASSPTVANHSGPLTAIPLQPHVTRGDTATQAVEPVSATSSRAPSSVLTQESSRRPSQQDRDVLGEALPSARIVSPGVIELGGRKRASTVTNFSKPYGALQGNTLTQAPRPMRKTSHQALRRQPMEGGPTYRHFTNTSTTTTSSHKTSLSISSSIAGSIGEQSVSTINTWIPQTAQLESHEQTYHAWIPKHDDFRGSTQSVQSTGSSLQGSKHSSTFTKISSNTEATFDTDLDESKDFSLEDVIDLYADLGDVECQPSPNTQELNQRAEQIADAIDAPMGSLPTPGVEAVPVSEPLLTSTAVRALLFQPPALQSPTLAHDQYGFRKVSRDVTEEAYSTWHKDYSKFQNRRITKWNELMTDSNLSKTKPIKFPQPSSKVQRYIRKGIPPAWRGEAWFFYAGGTDLLAANRDHYVDLVVKSQTDALSKNDKEAVERDLHRTFPDNLHFKRETNSMSNQIIETPIMTALRRVLCAFAVDHPKIGYCQSLNFIAGLLLLFLPEEKAYWMLHIITTNLLPGTHELSLEGANVDLWVMMLALKQANPGVWAKVGGDVGPNSSRLPPISLCTTSWFMSVFIGTLPIESVLRVWDVLFYEGSKTLFRIALAIFRSGEMQIKSVQDPMETFQVVQSLPRSMVDIGTLFDLAFSRGEVGRRWIEKKRAERREFYAKERAIEKARRNSRDAGKRRTSISNIEDMRSPVSIDMNSPDSPSTGGGRPFWGMEPALGSPKA